MNVCENPLDDLSNCLAHAQYEGLADVPYQTIDFEKVHAAKTDEEKQEARKDYITKYRRPRKGDIEIIAMFAQTWGSTALGFNQIGGSAMTTAYTVVLRLFNSDEYLVYMGGEFCYRVTNPNQSFFDDITNRTMESQGRISKYNEE